MAKLADRSRNTKNIITRLKDAYKSFSGGLDLSNFASIQTNQSTLQWFIGSHSFNRKGLEYLIETGYTQNSVVYGAINKILFAQHNLIFTPYWAGKPYKSKTLTLDIKRGTFNLLTTGSCCIWDRPIVGFTSELEVIDTVNLTETYYKGDYSYKYLENGKLIDIKSEDLIICKIYDNPNRFTRFGLSPIQAAIMPIESMKEMFASDTALLKNKGSNILICSGYNEPMPIDEDAKNKFDRAINDRIKGNGHGSAISTGSKVEVHQLGRTPKELALWDGYKVKTRDIAIVFQLNPAILGDPDSNSYSSLNDAQRSLYNESCIPFTKVITDNKEVRKALGYEIYIDTSNVDVLQESQQLRAEKAKTNTDAIINLNTNVNNGTISRDIAIEILVSEWGFEQEEAQKVIIDKNTQSISTTDKVNVLSPIVATKVMESMTTNERRDLIGLQTIEGGEAIPANKPSF